MKSIYNEITSKNNLHDLNVEKIIFPDFSEVELKVRNFSQNGVVNLFYTDVINGKSNVSILQCKLLS